MKKNASPQLDSGWWKSNQPGGLKAAATLGKALLDYEKAKDKLAKQESEENYRASASALSGIEKAVAAALKEAEQSLKKPPAKGKFDKDDFSYTVDALKKYGKLLSSTRNEVESARSERSGEDDEAEGLLGQPDAYQRYLRKTTKKLETRPYTFGLGLAKKPADCRFIFHKTKGGRSLGQAVKSETGLDKLTWGVAGAHAEKASTLVLDLEGKQLPGMAKKLKKFLKAFKPLPFTDVMLMSNGEEVADLPDEEEEREWAALATEWAAWRDGTEVTRAITETELAGTLSDLCDRGDAAVEEQDDADELRNLMGEMARLIQGAASPASSSTQAARGADPGAAFKERLKALLPRIKGAAGTPPGENAKLKASEAGVFAGKKDFDQANALLGEAEALLDQSPAAAPEVDPGVAFKARLTALLPGIKQAAGTTAGDEAKLKASEAGVFARKKDFDQANAKLEEAEALLAAPAGQAGEVDARRVELARGLAQGGNPFPQPGQALEPEVLEVFRGPIDSAASDLTSRLDDLFERIRALHASIDNADEAWREQRAASLLEELAEYRAAVESNDQQLQSLSD